MRQVCRLRLSAFETLRREIRPPKVAFHKKGARTKSLGILSRQFLSLRARQRISHPCKRILANSYGGENRSECGFSPATNFSLSLRTLTGANSSSSGETKKEERERSGEGKQCIFRKVATARFPYISEIYSRTFKAQSSLVFSIFPCFIVELSNLVLQKVKVRTQLFPLVAGEKYTHFPSSFKTGKVDSNRFLLFLRRTHHKVS